MHHVQYKAHPMRPTSACFLAQMVESNLRPRVLCDWHRSGLHGDGGWFAWWAADGRRADLLRSARSSRLHHPGTWGRPPSNSPPTLTHITASLKLTNQLPPSRRLGQLGIVNSIYSPDAFHHSCTHSIPLLHAKYWCFLFQHEPLPMLCEHTGFQSRRGAHHDILSVLMWIIRAFIKFPSNSSGGSYGLSGHWFDLSIQKILVDLGWEWDLYRAYMQGSQLICPSSTWFHLELLTSGDWCLPSVYLSYSH